MKRHRKIVNENVKHTKGPRVHRQCYIRVPPPPIPRMSPNPPPPPRVQHAWRKKNFKNPGTNQRILKAKLIAIYLDCHISSANIGFRAS